MAKRLLDAARLTEAATNIARQHIIIRRGEWQRYTETSSLARAVRRQTDRVTLTAGAAVALGRRVLEDDVRFKGGEGVYEAKDGGVSGSAGFASRRGGGATESRGRDTFAQRADVGGQEADVLDAALEPAVEVPAVEVAERRRVDRAEPGLETMNADVFNRREKGDTSTQEGEEHVPPDVKLEGLFSTPKMSRMLGQEGKDSMNPYAGRQRLPPQPLPEMIAAEERRRKEAEEQAAQGDHNQRAPSVATSELDHDPSGPSEPIAEHDNETKNLAESIMQDTQIDATQPTATSDNPAPTEAAYQMRESRVPSSRFGRLWQYGGLATSMAFGAVGESFRRWGSGSGGDGNGSLMLSEANMNRLVAKLSRMRGAALKLGQMMSFQDSKLLPPTINAVLQRVQDSADYMPASQRDRVLRRNLGNDWRDLFASFEDIPFAAASIGQVHKATLASNGTDVAVKVQYPGVRNSIDSDLNNLSLLLTASRLLPKGLYLDKTIANARVELGWECDYEREAQACIRFAELVQDDREAFSVPEIYLEASGKDVLTAEFMHGTAVTKIPDLSQDDRDWVGTQILRLCLRELMEWRFMQTDPNWTNFLYNRNTRTLELLDFGASREFPRAFTDPYIRLLQAASRGDREQCATLSIELGYLTGEETSEMRRAHVDSILTLAEPFVNDAPDVYDFRDQTITDRVRANIGLMLRERLAPPPEETYSLHRKLSGAFLLCARLHSRVRAKDLFGNAIARWEEQEQSHGAA